MMPGATDVRLTPGASLLGDPCTRRQGQVPTFEPVKKLPVTTLPIEPYLSGVTTSTGGQGTRERFELILARNLDPIGGDSIPLQIWEGGVVDVDHDAHVMHVILDAKIGQMPKHTGEIDLEWVSPQDKDLVRPGAVFYLTLFKRTKRGSIENAQELRFRRRPSWSTAQLKQVDEDAAMLLSKMKALPTSE